MPVVSSIQNGEAARLTAVAYAEDHREQVEHPQVVRPEQHNYKDALRREKDKHHSPGANIITHYWHQDAGYDADCGQDCEYACRLYEREPLFDRKRNDVNQDDRMPHTPKEVYRAHIPESAGLAHVLVEDLCLLRVGLPLLHFNVAGPVPVRLNAPVGRCVSE